MVPTTADWSNTIGHMATTHFGLVSALFWAPWALKRASFGSKCSFFGAKLGPEIFIFINIYIGGPEEGRDQAKVCGNHEFNPGGAAGGS